MTMWDFATQVDREFEREADRASLLVEALTSVDRTANLFSITFGAGLIWRDNRLRVAVLADRDRLFAGSVNNPRPLGAVLRLPASPLFQIVSSLLGASPVWLDDVAVIVATPPERQNSISAPPLNGQAGARVRWNAGTGFLTAGHVAPVLGSTVDLANVSPTVTIGQVAWANDPHNNGTTIEPDLSIVQDAKGHAIGTVYTSKAKAGPADTITVATTGATDLVMGFMGYLYMPAQNQTLGDCYMSSNQITNFGDSGSAVLRGNDLIGHVVGASANFASYFQDISYLLIEGANPLRKGLPGLRL